MIYVPANQIMIHESGLTKDYRLFTYIKNDWFNLGYRSFTYIKTD